MSLLACIEIETDNLPDSAVIWLHGLGSSGHDFVPIVEELGLPGNMKIRFIFPHAPSIPVTINGGMVMPAWYDILEMNVDRRVDLIGMKMSSAAVTAIVDHQLEKGISADRIVLAGFSQGGAVAYHTFFSYKKPLAGLLAMSTYLMTEKESVLKDERLAAPLLVQHGKYDPVVPLELGKKAVTELQDLGAAPQFSVYPMEHSVCSEQIAEISTWLQQLLR